MKYLALALTLLLAVSSHAAPARRDHGRPSDEDRQNIRGPPGRQTQQVYSLPDYFKSALQSVANVAEASVRTVIEATADMRAEIQADIESLKRDTERDFGNLEDVIEKHKAEYMEEILSQFQDSELDNLKGKLRTLIDSLNSKFNVNVEEAKSASLPILNAIRAKLGERTEQAKQAVAPYAKDFKATVNGYRRKIFSKAQGITAEDLGVLQRRVTPLATDISFKLQQIFGIISETFNEE